MTFQEALVLLQAGAKVGSTIVLGEGSTGYLFLNDGVVSVMGSDGDYECDLVLDTTVITATDFYEVPTVAETPSLVAYYDRAKGRWVSTSNPDRHRASGAQVKVFVAQD